MIDKCGEYFYVECINGCYYHIILNTKYDDDFDTSRAIGLSTKNYYRLLINNFQAKRHYDIIVFTDIFHLKEAIAYIEKLYTARLIMAKLTKE
jgi:hypothetical protein